MSKRATFKQSQIEWIGLIPTHWEMKRGKYLFTPKKNVNNEFQSKNLLALTLSGVVPKDINSSIGLRPKDYKTYQIFRKNDLVFKMIDLENINTSRVGLVHEKGIMSPVYLRFQPIEEKIHPKFAYWVYYDMYKKDVFNFIGRGVRSSLSSKDLLEVGLPVPSIQEQNFIARYIDSRLNIVDETNDKIRQKIDLLKEQRKVLINNCVTKGLDSTVEMKDSGVEWIGDIPKHWKAVKLKHVANHIMKKRLPNFGEIKISAENVEPESGEIKNLYSRYQTEGQIFQKGDVLFNKLGVYLNKVVYCDFEGLSMSEMIVLRPYRIFAKYLQRILSSIRYIEHIDSHSRGVKLPRASVENIMNAYVAVPPKSEQVEIAEYLDKIVDRINRMISLESRRIELLKEYRQSLISSAVTGKIRISEEMI